MSCQFAGCNMPEGECSGACLTKSAPASPAEPQATVELTDEEVAAAFIEAHGGDAAYYDSHGYEIRWATRIVKRVLNQRQAVKAEPQEAEYLLDGLPVRKGDVLYAKHIHNRMVVEKIYPKACIGNQIVIEDAEGIWGVLYAYTRTEPLSANGTPPEGYVLVPIEPTEAVLKAGWNMEWVERGWAIRAYAAVIKAAAPASQDGEGK